jgi:hypothetical protein
VKLAATCATGTATPIAPRTSGGRTYLLLRGIDPRYAGTMYDVFPGGCVSCRFDVEPERALRHGTAAVHVCGSA